MKEKDGVYYLVNPGIYGERMVLKYEVKDGKIGKIWIYGKYGSIEGYYCRERKLEMLDDMKKSEEFGDYEDCFYESEESFKSRIKRWKKR